MLCPPAEGSVQVLTEGTYHDEYTWDSGLTTNPPAATPWISSPTPFTLTYHPQTGFLQACTIVVNLLKEE